MHQNRWLLTALFAFALALCSACASQRPHVAVFYFGPHDADTHEDIEVIADFSYYMEGIKAWLEESDIPYSVHTHDNVAVELSSGKSFSLSGEELGEDIGFVLIKPDATCTVLHGVHTDIDFIRKASAYFEMENPSAATEQE